MFSTIVENIKSFFVKEEELLAQPKAIPESASEVFERPGAVPRRILDKNLPADARPAAPAPQPLPFTPDQLRGALAAKAPIAPQSAPVPVRPAPVEERDITNEIDAFETILRDAHREVETPRFAPVPATVPVARRERPLAEVRESAFDALDAELLAQGVEGEGVLDKDLLHRLREFHKHQREGKQYYFRTRDAKAAVARKIAELKLLEREWLGARDEMDDLERGLSDIESEIETTSRELRDLLSQAKSASRLEKTAPAGQEFLLRDGRRLASLLDLRVALRTMPPDVFRHHVTGGRHDFATWTRLALGEAVIADEMSRITDQHELASYLSKIGA